MLGNLPIAIRVRDLADRKAEARELIAKEAERDHAEANSKEDRRYDSRDSEEQTEDVQSKEVLHGKLMGMSRDMQQVYAENQWNEFKGIKS